MKFLKKILLTLTMFISMLFLNGCKDPAETALETPEGSSNLEGINEYEEDLKEGLDALNEISDESILIKIINEAKNSSIQEAAVKKISSQETLTHIVINYENAYVRKAAAESINNQLILLRVCLNDASSSVREAAVKKLCNQQMISKLNAEKESKEMQIMYMVIKAFDNIREEYRYRLMSEILPAVALLSYTEITNQFGEILSIEAYWNPRSAWYVSQYGGISQQMRGEQVYFSIKLQKLPESLSASWSTYFPDNVISVDTGRFNYALVDLSDLLYPVLDRLPSVTLTKIAVRTIDWYICEYCTGKIKDQNLLTKIAIESNDWGIWDFVDSINHQSSLRKIVLEAKNPSVRCRAISKITDQLLLTQIAIKDRHSEVMKAAVEGITDRRLLEKVADESLDETISEFALEKYEQQ